MEALEEALTSFRPAELLPDWNHIWPSIQANTAPPYFLVGGAITRTILNGQRENKLPIRNYDFAVGALAINPIDGPWKLDRNMFGNWKVISGPIGIAAPTCGRAVPGDARKGPVLKLSMKPSRECR